MTSSVVGPRRSSKALPKAKLAPKKGHGLWWPDPLQLSESQHNHYIWEVCSANQGDSPKTAMSADGIGQQNGPNSPRQCSTTCRTTNASKVEWIGLWSLASSTWPLANWLPLVQHLNNFCREDASTSSRRQKMLSKSLLNSWARIFFLFYFYSWRLITLQYCSGFCHALTWISHGFTCFPSWTPLLPPSSSSHPSESSQCTSPEHLSHASNLGWWSVSP